MRREIFRAISATVVMVSLALFGESSALDVQHGNSVVSLNAQQSQNWCGYQLMGGAAGFNQVSGTWTVSKIAASSSETASSTWTGIGGGCAESSCTVVDPTLIQAGTEADNNGDGTQSYYAWWEAIPAPSVPASGGLLSSQSFEVKPGDAISVSIDGSNLVVWKITIMDVRAGALVWTFTTTVPYSAAGLTAEWIEESPLVAGTSGAGQITLSNFGTVPFSSLLDNKRRPTLQSSQQVLMVDSKGNVLCRPSAPTSTGFDVCYGSGTCQ